MAAGLSLSSPQIKPNAAIPASFTCDGAGQSPTLMIQGVPSGAASLVVEVIDPDAPHGDFLHWGLYNLATNTAFLAAGAAGHDLPGPATSVTNGYDKPGYGAICPPSGQTHHYRFVLYALDTRLSGQPDDKAALDAAMQGHVMAQTDFTARYTRP
ncbi:YbhB/YbcL family Raf kinase inhibitor-like protein [Salinisphaera sp. Q1T1-3]|uniref:YbhB/YbcL family Raf kinase inhibitor-like protein n=1 Tax=Salinisphaera sp. Q1T1-3 TaxID=2321229 RepID=UPI002101341E|nr:YbhB/YbcL family Raf kinase inhibitor-like protein [Salinisphaera sp. Q1T1-3]